MLHSLARSLLSTRSWVFHSPWFALLLFALLFAIVCTAKVLLTILLAGRSCALAMAPPSYVAEYDRVDRYRIVHGSIPRG